MKRDVRQAFKIAALTCFASFAHAQTASSIYTDFNLKNCKTVKVFEEDGGGTYRCKGIKGYDVVFSEGDLRGTLSFGKNADKHCSSFQTFGYFNSPGTKIEWRIDNGKPFATIFRWFTDNGEKDGKQNWLVVTKLGVNESCRTALIDTKYPNANVEAQRQADITRNFNCEKDMPVVVATTAMKADEMGSGMPCGKGPYGQ